MRTLTLTFEINDDVVMTNDEIVGVANEMVLRIKNPEVPPTHIPPRKVTINGDN